METDNGPGSNLTEPGATCAAGHDNPESASVQNRALETSPAQPTGLPTDPRVLQLIRPACARETPFSAGRMFGKIRSTSGRIVAGLALAAAGGLLGYDQYLARHQPVWIVNGLHSPIHVRIDGEDREIGPLDQVRISLGEGRHHCELADQSTQDSAFPFELRGQWLQRFGRRPLTVLDPGESTAYLWQQIAGAASTASPGRNLDQRLHIGDRLVQFSQIDFPFQGFPPSTRAARNRTTISRLAIVSAPPARTLAMRHLDWPVAGNLLAYAEHHLERSPTDLALLEQYVALGREADNQTRAREFIRPRTDQRPVIGAWHEAFQDLVVTPDELAVLGEEYETLQSAEPDNPELLYLRARLEPDYRHALELCSRAVQLNPQLTAAWHLPAMRLRLAGRFAEALQALEKVRQQRPDTPRLMDDIADLHLALGRSQTVESALRERVVQSPDDLGLRLLLLEAQTALGTEPGRHQLRSHTAEQQPADSTAIPETDLLIEATWLDLHGQDAELGEVAVTLHDPQLRSHFLMVAALAQATPRALHALDPSPLIPPGYGNLVLALAWSEAGHPEMARQLRQEAIREFERQRPDQWCLAEALRQPESLSSEATIGLSAVGPAWKSVALVALVDAGTAADRQVLELARRLNYRRGFPARFLDRQILRLMK